MAGRNEQAADALRDALADILDFTSGWCRPMPDAEKFALIHKIAAAALRRAASDMPEKLPDLPSRRAPQEHDYAEALERTDKALRAVLASKPVRDADEILAGNAWLLFADGTREGA